MNLRTSQPVQLSPDVAWEKRGDIYLDPAAEDTLRDNGILQRIEQGKLPRRNFRGQRGEFGRVQKIRGGAGLAIKLWFGPQRLQESSIQAPYADEFFGSSLQNVALGAVFRHSLETVKDNPGYTTPKYLAHVVLGGDFYGSATILEWVDVDHSPTPTQQGLMERGEVRKFVFGVIEEEMGLDSRAYYREDIGTPGNTLPVSRSNEVAIIDLMARPGFRVGDDLSLTA